MDRAIMDSRRGKRDIHARHTRRGHTPTKSKSHTRGPHPLILLKIHRIPRLQELAHIVENHPWTGSPPCSKYKALYINVINVTNYSDNHYKGKKKRERK